MGFSSRRCVQVFVFLVLLAEPELHATSNAATLGATASRANNGFSAKESTENPESSSLRQQLDSLRTRLATLKGESDFSFCSGSSEYGCSSEVEEGRWQHCNFPEADQTQEYQYDDGNSEEWYQLCEQSTVNGVCAETCNYEVDGHECEKGCKCLDGMYTSKTVTLQDGTVKDLIYDDGKGLVYCNVGPCDSQSITCGANMKVLGNKYVDWINSAMELKTDDCSCACEDGFVSAADGNSCVTPVSSCNEGQYISNGLCEDCTSVCSSNQYITGSCDGTGTSDSITCTVCTTCGDGEMTIGSCDGTTTTDVTCKACHTCDESNENEFSSCTGNTDTICECKSGYFGTPSGTGGAGSCAECHTCGSNENEVSSCTATSDATCECKSGYFGTPSANGVAGSCAACHTCESNENEVSSCTGTSDATCACKSGYSGTPSANGVAGSCAVPIIPPNRPDSNDPTTKKTDDNHTTLILGILSILFAVIGAGALVSHALGAFAEDKDKEKYASGAGLGLGVLALILGSVATGLEGSKAEGEGNAGGLGTGITGLVLGFFVAIGGGFQLFSSGTNKSTLSRSGINIGGSSTRRNSRSNSFTNIFGANGNDGIRRKSGGFGFGQQQQSQRSRQYRVLEEDRHYGKHGAKKRH